MLMDPSEVMRDIIMLAHTDSFQAVSSKLGIHWWTKCRTYKGSLSLCSDVGEWFLIIFSEIIETIVCADLFTGSVCAYTASEWIQWRTPRPCLGWRWKRWRFRILSCLIPFPSAIISIYSSHIRKNINISKKLITASKTSSKLFI